MDGWSRSLASEGQIATAQGGPGLQQHLQQEKAAAEQGM